MRVDSSHPTLLAVLWPESRKTLVLHSVILAVTATLLLTLSAKVQVPFWPVPMTMQTFVVLLIGAAFGPRLGMATVALYLAQGAVGFPVFAGTPEKGLGLAYMAGPTGGYLVGFLLAAGAVGYLAQRGWDRTVLGTLGAMLIGTAVIYLPGIAWLSSLIGFEKALQFGLVPFLPSAALKIALAVAVLPFAWKLLSKTRG